MRANIFTFFYTNMISKEKPSIYSCLSGKTFLTTTAEEKDMKSPLKLRLLALAFHSYKSKWTSFESEFVPKGSILCLFLSSSKI